MSDSKIYFGGDIANRLRTTNPNINPNDITLKDLRFLSTHNSIITDTQFGGRMSYDTFLDMIPLLKDMPLCFELDISFLSGLKISDESDDVHDVFLDHFTKLADLYTPDPGPDPGPDPDDTDPDPDDPDPDPECRQRWQHMHVLVPDDRVLRAT